MRGLAGLWIVGVRCGEGEWDVQSCSGSLAASRVDILSGSLADIVKGLPISGAGLWPVYD